MLTTSAFPRSIFVRRLLWLCCPFLFLIVAMGPGTQVSIAQYDGRNPYVNHQADELNRRDAENYYYSQQRPVARTTTQNTNKKDDELSTFQIIVGVFFVFVIYYYPAKSVIAGVKKLASKAS